MKLIWSPLSIQRVQEIADYIAADKISAADTWVDSMFNKVEKLKSEPEIGRSAIRELIFGNYRIIYTISKQQILILTVRHFKQILPVDEVASGDNESANP